MFKAMTDINTHEIIEAFMSPSVSFLGKGYIGSFSTEAVTTLTQFEADEQLVTGNMLPGVNYYNVEYDVFGAKLKQITISHPALVHGDFIIREELCSSGLSTTFYNDGRGYILEEVYDDFRNLNEVYKNLTVSKVTGDSNLIVDNDAEVIKPHNLTRGTKVDNRPSKIYDVKKEPIEPSDNFLMGIAAAAIGTAIYTSNDSNSNDSDINYFD